MKKTFFIAGSFLILSAFSLHADWLDQAKGATETLLEPLTRDIGAVLGGGLYGNTGPRGFPGVDVGLRAAVAKVSEDNTIVAESNIGGLWALGEVGLPGGIDIFARGFSVKPADAEQNLTLMGIGVRYNFLKDMVISPIPGLCGIAAVNKISVTDVEFTTLTVGVVASKKILFIAPYAGLALDQTTGKIKNQILGTLEPQTTESRIVAGLQIRPLPLLYLHGGISITGGNTGIEIGAGLRI